MDGIAASWAFRNGKTAEEWYTTFISGIQSLSDEQKNLIRTGKPLTPAQKTELGNALGMVEFMENGTALISAFEGSNITTAFEELFHIVRRTSLSDDQLAALEKWVGVQNGIWSVSQEEKAAKAFLKFLSQGKAPTSDMKGIFDSISKWFKETFKFLKKSPLRDVGVMPADVIKAFEELTSGIPDAAPGSPKLEGSTVITPEAAENTNAERSADIIFTPNQDKYPDVLDVEGDINIENEALELARTQGISPGSKPLKYIIRDQGKIIGAVFRSKDNGQYVFDLAIHEEYKGAANESQLIEAVKDEWVEQSNDPVLMSNTVDHTLISELVDQGFVQRDNSPYHTISRAPNVLLQDGQDFFTEAHDHEEPAMETVNAAGGNIAPSPLPSGKNAINHTNQLRDTSVEYDDQENLDQDKSLKTVTNERNMAFNVDISEFIASVVEGFEVLNATKLINMIRDFNPIADMEYIRQIAPEAAEATLDNINTRDRLKVHTMLFKKYSALRNSMSKRKEQLESDLENSTADFAEIRAGLRIAILEPKNLDAYNNSAKEYSSVLLKALTIDPDLNDSANRMNEAIRILNEMNGTDTDIAGNSYYEVLEKFGNENANTRLDDVLMAVSSLGLKWNEMSMEDTLQAIENFQSSEKYRESLRGGNADNIRNGFRMMQIDPELKALAATYATTHTLETKLLEGRIQAGQIELNQATEAIDLIPSMNDDEIINASNFLQKTHAQHDLSLQIESLMLDYQKKFNHLENLLPNLQKEIADLEHAINSIKGRVNRSASEIGVTRTFNGKPGESYLIMDPVEGGQEIGTGTFNYDGDNVSAHEALVGNRKWVELNQDNPNIDPILLNQMKSQNDVMFGSLTKGDVPHVKQVGWQIALESVQQFFQQVGFDEGRRLSQMFLFVQKTMNETIGRFTPLTQKWERAEGELRKAAGFKSASRFKRDVLINVYSHLESLEGIVNDRTALNSGYEVLLTNLKRI